MSVDLHYELGQIGITGGHIEATDHQRVAAKPCGPGLLTKADQTELADNFQEFRGEFTIGIGKESCGSADLFQEPAFCFTKI